MPRRTASSDHTGSQHLSLRISSDVRDRLVRAAHDAPHESRSRLAARLIDEGLRMESHPGIVFRNGPAGRRPGLAAGPDVWEVARVLRDCEGEGEQLIADTAKLTGLPRHQVRTVASYYRAYRAEIDLWIDEVDRAAQEAAGAAAR